MKLRIALIALLLPVAAFGKTQNAPRPTAPAAPSGFRAEALANIDEVQGKLNELVQITPEESFGWRPGPGVRSISEVYMHIAGWNYYLATYVGVDAPRSHADLEKNVTKKAEVLAELNRSFDHLRMTIDRTRDLEKQVKLHGRTTTYRGVLLTMISHLHEHFGQSIAYARMTGVTPPWTR